MQSQQHFFFYVDVTDDVLRFFYKQHIRQRVERPPGVLLSRLKQSCSSLSVVIPGNSSLSAVQMDVFVRHITLSVRLGVCPTLLATR